MDMVYHFLVQNAATPINTPNKKKKIGFVKLEATASMYDQKLDLQFKYF